MLNVFFHRKETLKLDKENLEDSLQGFHRNLSYRAQESKKSVAGPETCNIWGEANFLLLSRH